MPNLKPLGPNEYCRVQVLSVPDDRAMPEHVAIFIEAREIQTVEREIHRLGGSRGVVRAVFAEPAETPRETYTSHGFLCADSEFLCSCPSSRPAPRNFLRWGLPSSRSGSKR